MSLWLARGTAFFADRLNVKCEKACMNCKLSIFLFVKLRARERICNTRNTYTERGCCTSYDISLPYYLKEYNDEPLVPALKIPFLFVDTR
jgi:hypothetical protein